MLQNNPANKNTNIAELIKQTIAMTNELLALCDYHITDDPKKALTMARDFPRLAALGRSRLLIPLQESLNANLPPNSSSASEHQPFAPNAPLFESKHRSCLYCVVTQLKRRIRR
jgi:serine/threonine-protein kinase ATR